VARQANRFENSVRQRQSLNCKGWGDYDVKKRLSGFITVLAALMLAITGAAHAQGNTAKLHGHTNNPVGQALKAGDVKLTTDKTSAAKDRKYQYSFAIDANGDYKGEGIAPGDYLAVVLVDNKSVDYQNVTVKAADDKTLDLT
jgi:hypothetical protein